MIRSKGTLTMRQLSLKLACAVLAGSLVLAGCGGGSPSTGGSTDFCELPLAFANGGTSGTRIDAVAQTVDRQFNPCPVKRVQSLTVAMCIDHPQINELSAQLVFPDGSAQSLSIQSASSAGTCRLGGLFLQATHTSGGLQSLQGLTGNWSLKVTDNNPITTTIGSLVGWSLRAEGLR